MNNVSSREEKISKIQELLKKAKELTEKQQQLRQEFIDHYQEATGDEEWLSEKRGDFRVRHRELGEELIDTIIEIAKEKEGLEQVKINMRDWTIIDETKEAGI